MRPESGATKGGAAALPELEKIVSEVKSGNRVILFAPGTSSFILGQLIGIAAFVFLIGSLGKLLGSQLTTGTSAMLQLGLILVAVGCNVFPGIMLIRGHKQYRTGLIWISRTLIVLALILISICSWSEDFTSTSIKPLIISSVFAFCSDFIYTRPSFIVFCEYFYLMKRN